MSKLVRSFGKSVLDGLFNTFRADPSTGLVRMFEVEYQREYKHAVRAGAEINDAFVKSYLSSQRIY